MEHKSTPEEQLLKLIENPAAEPTTSASKADSAPKPKKEKFSFPSFRLPGFLKRHQSKGQSLALEDANPFAYIKGVNALLVAGVVACGIYLALDLSILKGDPKNFLSQISLNDSIYPLREDQKAETAQHDVKYYHDLIDRRNPFILMSGKPAPKEEKPEALSLPKPQSEQMSKLLQSIKLVGISWTGGSPLAMIEETESGKTFFLRQGQEINGLKVQSIDKEKAVVTYEGEEASLF